MTLEEVLHVLDEDKDEPMMAGSDEEFDVLEDIEIHENEDETNCRYQYSDDPDMITGIVVQADEWNDLQQDTSHTVDSNDNHAGNNNMLKHT